MCFHLDKILEMTNLTKLSDEQIGCFLAPVVEEEIHWDGHEHLFEVIEMIVMVIPWVYILVKSHCLK